MMNQTYTITFSPEAERGLSKLKRSEPSSFKKAVKLLGELALHPKVGTGHPEPLKGATRRAVEPADYQETPARVPHLRNGGSC